MKGTSSLGYRLRVKVINWGRSHFVVKKTQYGEKMLNPLERCVYY